MKFLVCGVGSIGERHINNLLSLGENNIILYRQKNIKLRTVTKNLETFTSIEKALAKKPDAAIISNPTSLHISLATQLATTGCHLFIEKPLSHNHYGVKKLSKIVRRKKIIVQIGYMMRYHPAMIEIKKILHNKTIGEALSARISWGEYLPLWHPWENYKNSYSAKKELGGGPILTLSHDVDLLYWLFGKPEKLLTIKSKKSFIKTSTEQNVETLFKYKSGFITELHLDYLQLPPERIWTIIGSKGKVEFNYYDNKLVVYKLNSNKISFSKKEYDYSKTFDRNILFTNEIKDFINSVRDNSTPKVSLRDGEINLQILKAMHTSMKREKIVKISYS